MGIPKGKFYKHTVPTNINPLVIQFFKIVNAQQIAFTTLEKKSGVTRACFYRWRETNSPTITCFQAVLNALGYDLRIVKMELKPMKIEDGSDNV